MRRIAWIGGMVLALAGCGLGGGSSAPAPVAPVNPNLLPTVKRCPPATGSMSPGTIGKVHLGMTRAQARQAYTQSTLRGTPDEDFFCLRPIGVRVGYPSGALLHAEPAATAYSDRVVWASTANGRYSIAGVKPGSRLAAIGRLHPVGPIRVGVNAWYFAGVGPSTAVFKVVGGSIQEVGIAVRALTGTPQADQALITSLPPLT